jgi:hypothetical protein
MSDYTPSPTPYSTTKPNANINPSCSSYVACQRQYIQAIQDVNQGYRALLESTLKTEDNAYKVLETNLNTAINKMRAAISSFQVFLSQHGNDKSSSYSTSDYANIQSMRLELAEQSDMLKSRYGAPKEYGAATNFYDEYRSNYNTMMYAFIIACLMATVLLFFLFRMI